MTEAEWLTTDEVGRLLFSATVERKCSTRKMRLLSCAFARSVLPVALDGRAASLLTFAEGAIEGLSSDGGRSECRKEVGTWYRDILPKTSRFAVSAIYYALGSGTPDDCRQASEVARRARDYSPTEKAIQAHLLRCIFGNPFRPVAFDPRWRSETAVALASAIYAERVFDRLPILADALEEAGCDHPDVLSHCRGPGPHARGCGVVDAVLNKV